MLEVLRTLTNELEDLENEARELRRKSLLQGIPTLGQRPGNDQTRLPSENNQIIVQDNQIQDNKNHNVLSLIHI